MKRLARLLIGTALLCLAVVLSLAALSPERVHAPGQNQVPTTIVVEQTTEQPEWYRYQVFVTNYGTKYHRQGCHYLRQSCYSIALINAINGGYTACSYCHPPLPEASGEGQKRENGSALLPFSLFSPLQEPRFDAVRQYLRGYILTQTQNSVTISLNKKGVRYCNENYNAPPERTQRNWQSIWQQAQRQKLRHLSS